MGKRELKYGRIQEETCSKTSLVLLFCHSEQSEDSEYIHFVFANSSFHSE